MGSGIRKGSTMSGQIKIGFNDPKGILIKHPSRGALLAEGLTVPADASTGYAPGCIFLHTDGTAGAVVYVNDGTSTSSEFNAISITDDGVFSASTTSVVFNEDSNDMDIRVESNANANFLNIDGSGLLNGQLAIGAAVPTNPQATVALLPPANATGVTADQSYYHATLLPGGATTIPTGTAPIVASLNVAEPNITATGTVTVGATVRIADAPTEGTDNFSLWVDAGASRFDGDVVVGAASVPTNPQASFAVLPQTRTATANQSYFHAQILATGGAITVPAGTAPVVASLNIHEPNITSTGTTTAACTLRIVDAPTEGSSNYALWVDAGVTRLDGNLEFSAALDVVTPANTAAALEINDGTTAFVALDTRNTVTVQNVIIQGPASQTLPDGATSRLRVVSIPAKTVTLAGTTQVTTENLGMQVFIDAPTVDQSGGAVTVDRVSALHVGTPVAGASVTITTNHIISTGTAGCFCTAAGAWTDTSGEDAKEGIIDADLDDVVAVLDEVKIKKFRYKDSSDGGGTRYGGIAEYVPDEIAMPGRKGIAARDVAWLAVASAKHLRAENANLLARLEAIEAKLNPV